jgi:HEAT repeat protein
MYACFLTPYRLERAVQKFDSRALIDHLQNGRHGYIRERAAFGLHTVSPTKAIPEAQNALRSCVSLSTEFDYVRAACARTLSIWHDPKVADLIIDALPSVDAESRYWMAFSLKHLENPQAKAQLQALRNDSDPVLASSVRQWLGD